MTTPQQPCEPCVDEEATTTDSLVDLCLNPGSMDALRHKLGLMLPAELEEAVRSGGSNGHSVLFDAVRGGTVSAFGVVDRDTVNTVREHSTGNTLLMAAIMTKDLAIVRHVVETLGYNTFMAMRAVDHATAMHLIACLSNAYHSCAKYLIEGYGDQMVAALTMVTEGDGMNPLHYMAKYGGIDTMVVIVNNMSQYQGFTEACYALNDGLAQPALLALHFDEERGAEKAYVLEGEAPLRDRWNGHNAARLVRGDHNFNWFMFDRHNADFFAQRH